MSAPLPSAARFQPGRGAVPACPCGCGDSLFVVRVPGVEAYWMCDGCGWVEGEDVPDLFDIDVSRGWPAQEARA